MTNQRMLQLVVASLLVGWLLVACGPSPTPVPATETLPPPEALGPGGQCGDGFCDEAEKEDPNLCPQDCPAAEVAAVATAPPTEPPPPPPAVPDTPAPGAEATKPGGKCGDGVCDELEKKDPNLCPQDCAQSPEPDQVPSTGVPDYEPPINVFLVLHSDPDMAGEQFTFRATPVDYQRTRDGIDWLMEEAARHNLRFTALYNGWYPMEALETGDLSQFQSLLDAGHEIGTHAHRMSYDPAQDLWTAHVEELSFYGRPNYDPFLARQCWTDAAGQVEAVLQAIGAAGQNQTMCTRTFTFLDEGTLMEGYGFTIAAGNRAELSINYFGHMVWNPWRPAANDEPGHDLEEDLTRSFLSLDHLAQIGSHEASHPVDLTVPHLQRRFLMLYVEWLARVRLGAEDKVWDFGFVYHPNYTDRYLADLSEFLYWLDENFVGKTTSQGYSIARYATVGEIAREFTAWEAAHPGTSSFSYVRGDPYPYTYAIVTTKLEDAAYEAPVDLGQGVSCYRFSKEGQAIYMLWSDAGEQTVNLSGQLPGQVRVTDAAGRESLQDASALALTGDPLFVEPPE
jgi:hypothetical protein